MMVVNHASINAGLITSVQLGFLTLLCLFEFLPFTTKLKLSLSQYRNKDYLPQIYIPRVHIWCAGNDEFFEHELLQGEIREVEAMRYRQTSSKNLRSVTTLCKLLEFK